MMALVGFICNRLVHRFDVISGVTDMPDHLLSPFRQEISPPILKTAVLILAAKYLWGRLHGRPNGLCTSHGVC